MDNQHFNSNSLALCAFLISRNFSLLRVIRNNPQVTFVFKSSPELLQAVEDFTSLTASTEPQHYFNSLRYLKGILHSRKKELYV